MTYSKVEVSCDWRKRRGSWGSRLAKKWRENGASFNVVLTLWLTLYAGSFLLSSVVSGADPGFLSFGSPCNGPLACNRHSWLECREGHCNCTQSINTLYDEQSSRCVGRIGSSCFQFGVGPYCEGHSICKITNEHDQSFSKKKYFGICQRKTFPLFTNSQQNQENEENQNQNQNQILVWIQPGERCDPLWTNSACGGNSICEPIQGQVEIKNSEQGEMGNTHYQCKCHHNSSIDSSGNCTWGFMGICAPHKNLSCNRDAFLECVDGICLCQNPIHQRYSPSMNKCGGIVGTSCVNFMDNLNTTSHQRQLKGEKRVVEQSPTTIFSSICTENGECHQGKCRCQRNYFETPSGTCVPDIPYQMSCQEGQGQCNLFKGMACQRGQCLCLDSNMEFDLERGMCAAKIGSTCGQVSILGFNKNKTMPISCVKHSQCSKKSTGRSICTI